MSQIQMYVHCGRCLDGLRPGERYRPSIEVGFTDLDEIQVWCKRHDMEIGTFPLDPEFVKPHVCAECEAADRKAEGESN